LRNLLKVENLDSGYGPVQILWDVSLYVDYGEIVALLGPNGAGKTTLLKTIVGIIKPKKGTILFDNIPINGQPCEKIVDLGITLVLAEKELFPLLTVEENLLLGAFNKRARKRIEGNLELVYTIFPKLKERAKQKAGSMSGGEQQMLAIGRALMSDPKLLLLDEPSAGLAPLYVKILYNSIRNLMEMKESLGILIVEQRVMHVEHLCERGYIITNGRIVYQGEITASSQVLEFFRKYLGVR
jgi:branched-chain amino acid transport system ATP-binding protein